jgi:hypothetical protein
MLLVVVVKEACSGKCSLGKEFRYAIRLVTSTSALIPGFRDLPEPALLQLFVGKL